tara:strand:+ start:960 stop:1232 length:273 start_codon:yes stop_codon:yes gene_type:complete
MDIDLSGIEVKFDKIQSNMDEILFKLNRAKKKYQKFSTMWYNYLNLHIDNYLKKTVDIIEFLDKLDDVEGDITNEQLILVYLILNNNINN